MNRILIAGLVLFLSACGGSIDNVLDDAKSGKLSVGKQVKFEGVVVESKRSIYGDTITFEPKNWEDGSVIAIVDDYTKFKVKEQVKADCNVANYQADKESALVIVNQCSFVK